MVASWCPGKISALSWLTCWPWWVPETWLPDGFPKRVLWKWFCYPGCKRVALLDMNLTWCPFLSRVISATLIILDILSAFCRNARHWTPFVWDSWISWCLEVWENELFLLQGGFGMVWEDSPHVSFLCSVGVWYLQLEFVIWRWHVAWHLFLYNVCIYDCTPWN